MHGHTNIKFIVFTFMLPQKLSHMTLEVADNFHVCLMQAYQARGPLMFDKLIYDIYELDLGLHPVAVVGKIVHK